MPKFWDFVRDEKNRAVIGWLGGGLIAVVGAGWALFTHFEKDSDGAKPTVQVTASGGSVAVGGVMSVRRSH